MDKYRIISKSDCNETVIKKSRFIATFSRVADENAAKNFIQEVKMLHKDANHNCSAYIIGTNPEISRVHDDGEPVGTAGVPMLEVLKALQLRNTAVVVTRYFGGIKLGAGGLIRAYGGAVSAGIKKIGISERSIQSSLLFNVPYNQQGSVDYFLNNNQISVVERVYGVDISYKIFVTPAKLSFIISGLTEISHGQFEFTKEESRYVEQPLNL